MPKRQTNKILIVVQRLDLIGLQKKILNSEMQRFAKKFYSYIWTSARVLPSPHIAPPAPAVARPDHSPSWWPTRTTKVKSDGPKRKPGIFSVFADIRLTWTHLRSVADSFELLDHSLARVVVVLDDASNNPVHFDERLERTRDKRANSTVRARLPTLQGQGPSKLPTLERQTSCRGIINKKRPTERKTFPK